MPGTSSGGIAIPLDTDVAGDLALAVRNVVSDLEAAWVAYTPTIANMTLGNGTVIARRKRIGKTIHFRIYLLSGTTTTYTATSATFTLPFQAHASGVQAVTAYMNGNVGGIGNIPANSLTVTPLFSSAAGNTLLSGVATATFNPGAGTGGYLVIEGTYEAA